MARIALSPEVLDDFERIFAHLERFDVEDPPARIDEIVQAIQILVHSPRIGRPVKNGRRELVIGRGSHGTIALHRYEPPIDVVFVLAIRGQRELGQPATRSE